MLASGGTLRKLLGVDGIDIATNLTSLPDGSYAGELQISGSALLQAIANLTALVNQKQTMISVANPIPSFDFVYGLGEALTNAASQVVTIDSIPNLATALANKQPLLGATSSAALAALTCSLIRAAVGQNLNLSDDAGTVLLGLAPNPFAGLQRHHPVQRERGYGRSSLRGRNRRDDGDRQRGRRNDHHR